MRFHKVFHWLLPLFVGTALIGSGFAVFSFAELNTSKTFSDAEGPDVGIDALAEAGTLTVEPVIATGEGYAPFTADMILVFMQSRVYLPFTHFHLEYAPGSDWDSGVTVPITIQVEMALPESVSRYIVSDSWDASSDVATGHYVYTFPDFDIQAGASAHEEYLPIPVFAYRSGMSPITQEEYFDMQSAVSDQEVEFVFTAILNS